jgi:peptidoglycan/LPS O-acetylase OafA/YrhL
VGSALKIPAGRSPGDKGQRAAPAAGGSLLSRRARQLWEEVFGRGHDPGLDGVRGLAVGLVFFVHIQRILGPMLPESAGLQFWLLAGSVTGQVGVYLFFVLSGFLIYGLVLARKPRYGRFLWRRLQRIYPTFLAVAGLYLAVCVLVPSMSKLPPGGAAKLDYIARALVLLPGLAPEPPLVTVAWTLRYEMAFYLLVGLLTFAPARALARRPVRVGAALVLLALLLTTGMTAIATMFIFGILAREAHSALAERKLPTTGLAWTAAIAAVPASFYMFLPELRDAYPTMPAVIREAGIAVRFLVLGPILATLVLMAARPESPIARFCGWAPVRAFGIISYSYYLSHGIGIHLTEKLLQPAFASGYHSLPFAIALFGATFVLTVLVALVFFLAIEFPASIRKRIAY